MAAPSITTRQATRDDVEAIVATFIAGFETYGDFMPAGWRAPPFEEEREQIATRLADPTTWAMLALAGDAAVGHMFFVPARERTAADTRAAACERPLAAGMAHLSQLFVRPDWWGEGVAPLLHVLGIEAMRSQGYERARLFTPAAHGRARGFYERRGWIAVDAQYNPELALDMVEYRLELESSDARR